jgi:hypothetical protein
MATNPATVQMMIQAKERGKPRINGSAEEKKAYPGHIKNRPMISITAKNRILDGRKTEPDFIKWGGVLIRDLSLVGTLRNLSE